MKDYGMTFNALFMATPVVIFFEGLGGLAHEIGIVSSLELAKVICNMYDNLFYKEIGQDLYLELKTKLNV